MDTGTAVQRQVTRVLVVDDHEVFCRALGRDFARMNIAAFSATHVSEALKLSLLHQPELAVVDLYLTAPENGIALIAALKAARPQMYCILISAHVSVAHAVKALRAGADDVLIKPLKASQALLSMLGGARAGQTVQLRHELADVLLGLRSDPLPAFGVPCRRARSLKPDRGNRIVDRTVTARRSSRGNGDRTQDPNAAHHILSKQVPYQDLGDAYRQSRRDSNRKQPGPTLERIGYVVELKTAESLRSAS